MVGKKKKFAFCVFFIEFISDETNWLELGYPNVGCPIWLLNSYYCFASYLLAYLFLPTNLAVLLVSALVARWDNSGRTKKCAKKHLHWVRNQMLSSTSFYGPHNNSNNNNDNNTLYIALYCVFGNHYHEPQTQLWIKIYFLSCLSEIQSTRVHLVMNSESRFCCCCCCCYSNLVAWSNLVCLCVDKLADAVSYDNNITH